jgi:cell fate regulator YaaT (PSP1 superfamily)
MEHHRYLVRYGLTVAQIGRFASEEAHGRGDLVVIRSHRGIELGEVLVPAPDNVAPVGVPGDGVARVLRVARTVDRERARHAETDRSDWFSACRQVVQSGSWDLELLDIEPLLEDRRAVLHYLAARPLDDPASLVAALRRALDLDVLLEPVDSELGLGADESTSSPVDASAGACRCGSVGCGSSSACSDCGVQKLMAARR